MSTTNENGKQPEKMESVKEGTACCGPGCGCGTAAKPGKARWVVGVIVLAAAGVLVVKGMVKSDKGATQAADGGICEPGSDTSDGGRGHQGRGRGGGRNDGGNDPWRVCRIEHRSRQDRCGFRFPSREGRHHGQGPLGADEGGRADDGGAKGSSAGCLR